MPALQCNFSSFAPKTAGIAALELVSERYLYSACSRTVFMRVSVLLSECAMHGTCQSAQPRFVRQLAVSRKTYMLTGSPA